MNENLNLFEILKKYYNNETLYSPLMGSVKVNLNTRPDGLWVCKHGCCIKFTKEGKYHKSGELVLFPSKDQHDWNKWIDSRHPKTWSALIDSEQAEQIKVSTHVSRAYDTPIERSAQALLKIHQLINISYGGVPTKQERNHNTIYYIFKCWDGEYYVSYSGGTYSPISFHTKEQAEEFLNYLENRYLLDTFFMLS